KEVSVTPSNSTATAVAQTIHPVDKSNKSALLKHLVIKNAWFQVLVFVRTKHGANKLTKQLNAAEIKAAAIHGNKSQGARTRALAEFKNSEIQVLVATDIAARGLDIDQLPHVINYDLPNVPEDYVHRIGRTGRAGASGEAISLVSADEITQLNDIERLIGNPIQRLDIEGFQAENPLPESGKTSKRTQARKAKKKKPAHAKSSHSRPNTNKATTARKRRRPPAKNANQA
ncbi:MAG: ATP-dependent helicase, partial [Marinomonas atlantica]|nr:ATP-dependent helicase [Marinomonas atlantica]